MSYEGHRQVICKNGHYFERDCHSDSFCPICHEEDGWRNGVDDTNCDNSGDIPYQTLKELFLVSEAVVEKCNLGHSHTIKPTIFRIPTEEETNPLRTFQNEDVGEEEFWNNT